MINNYSEILTTSAVSSEQYPSINPQVKQKIIQHAKTFFSDIRTSKYIYYNIYRDFVKKFLSLFFYFR